MPALKNIRVADPVQAHLTFGGETLQLVFDRNLITGNWANRMAIAAQEIDPLGPARGLAEVLVSWDVTDENGGPVAPSAEVLADLPSALLGEMFQAIQDAAVPSRAEGNASSVHTNTPSSASTPQPVTPPNGTQPSPSPTPSASPSPT